LTYRNSSSARRRSQCRTWHSGEFSLARILHQYSTTFLINKCRTHSPVVEDSRQDHGNCARAHPFGGAGEHHVNRRTVPIDPWTRARQGEAAASDQMPTRWSDVDPAVLQDLAISSLRCPQRPCPRQNLGQPGLLANVDGYQDGGGKIPRQIPHDLDQWLHTPGRPADR
jgi:hypothetical protein